MTRNLFDCVMAAACFTMGVWSLVARGDILTLLAGCAFTTYFTLDVVGRASHD